MKRLVLTGFSPLYSELASKTLASIFTNADSVGADFECLNLVDAGATWATLHEVVRRRNRGYDEVMWIDIDCVFLNPKVNLFEAAYGDISFSVDGHGICAGLYVVRNQAGFELLEIADSIGDLTKEAETKFSGAYKPVQSTIKMLLWATAKWKVGTIPQSAISNHDSSEADISKSSVYHAWACCGVPYAISRIEKAIALSRSGA